MPSAGREAGTDDCFCTAGGRRPRHPISVPLVQNSPLIFVQQVRGGMRRSLACRNGCLARRLPLLGSQRVEVRHAGGSYREMVEGGKAVEDGRGLAPATG